jgi:hypothetical protein
MYWQYDNPISGGRAACPWDFDTSRYLGVKFVDTKGSLHYGWVRVSVSSPLTIVGYAYETIPNKPITTGVAHGNVDDARMFEPMAPTSPTAVSLGWLALGASGLAVWRRPEEEQAA